MLRVRAIAGEPTRFWVTGNTLLCDNPHCGREYNRMTRHQQTLGERQPTDYLADGTPCPACLARVKKWKAKCERLMYSMDFTLAQKEEIAVKLSKGEPIQGIARMPSMAACGLSA